MVAELAALLASYLLGAVPFGWLLAKTLRGVDLRRVGSGNIGATNAMRALGRPLGVVAFLGDFAKGLVPVAVLAPALDASGGLALPWLRVLCGAAAVAGHVWPVYLRFRGGKAVATGCGAVAAVDPVVVVVGVLVWVVVLGLARFVGLASMAMGAALAAAAWLRRPDDPPFALGASALALLILLRHRSNVARMLAGTEPRVGRKRHVG